MSRLRYLAFAAAGAALALAITLVKRGGRPASPHGTWEPVTRNDRP